MTADQALKEYGASACIAAYSYAITDGEGETFIEINTGIPKRHQGAAISAGEHICSVDEYESQASEGRIPSNLSKGDDGKISFYLGN